MPWTRQALTFDGIHVWVANAGNNSLTEVNAAEESGNPAG